MKATISPALEPLRGTVDPPSSKNYTTRYILASALAEGRSVVHRPAVQDDAVALVRCLRQFGAIITALDEAGQELDFSVANAESVDRVEVKGFGRAPQAPSAPVNPSNAGTVLRLLLGTAALVEGEVRFDTDYADSLGKRPNRDLLDALEQLGVEMESRGEGGALPIVIRGGRSRIKDYLRKRRADLRLDPADAVPISVSGEVSSQFLSSLLFLLPGLDETVRVSVRGELRSKPLIETTRKVLKDAGVEVESDADRYEHLIRRGQGFKARRWDVNGDWPGSAAIFGAAAAVPGSDIRVRRLYDDEQGEKRCLDYYASAGCTVQWLTEGGVSVVRLQSPKGGLRGAAINGDLCTDAVLAMMGAASVARGRSAFHGIGNLQYKECDRVRDPIEELAKINFSGSAYLEAENPPSTEMPRALADWTPKDDPDTIYVDGRPEGFTGGIEVDGRGDHRVIMLLSIVGLRCREGITVLGAEHVAKSFPGWFATLGQLGVRVDLHVEGNGERADHPGAA